MARRTAKGNYEHPAKYSAPILNRIVRVLEQEVAGRGSSAPLLVLDPFAGVGGIHRVVVGGIATTGIEIEPEWCEESNKLGPTVCMDFFQYAREVDGWFDAVVTSPTYGNRMADHHNARDTSRRNTYRHVLERELTAGSSSGMQWGQEYRDFHTRAIRAIWSILRPGGLFVLNISDHIRTTGPKGNRVQEVQPVVAWYRGVCRREGFEIQEDVVIPTKRLKMGANSEVRVDGEHLIVMRKGNTELATRVDRMVA